MKTKKKISKELEELIELRKHMEQLEEQMAATLNDLIAQLAALKTTIDQLTADVAKLQPPAPPVDMTPQVQAVTDANTAVQAADAVVKGITG